MTEDPGRFLAGLTDPFRVAGWEVDVASHRMRRGDETVKLEPRTMAVLVYLASRAGQVVTREELEQEIWAGRVVGYEALSNTIAKLRRAFEDDPGQPRIIETVPKAGYRLVAGVESIPGSPGREQAGAGDLPAADAGFDAPGDRSPEGRDPPVGRTAAGRRRRLLAMGGLVLVLLAAAGTIRFLQWNPAAPRLASPPAVDKPSVAVLPFDNLSPDPAQEFFAAGLTGDLITDLSRISGLFVIAPHSVFVYEDRSRPATEIADELGVRFVVEGSVQRAEGRIRINARLVDTSNGASLLAERYEANEMEVFALRDEVIGDIVDTLSVELTDTERTQLARRGTADLEAYDYYLRAEHHWVSCVQGDCMRRALALYRQAIAIDPGFIDAHAGIAELGRQDEARAELEPVYEEVPFANLAYYRTLLAHYKRDEDLEHMLGALEKAGIPQWPHGYEPAAEHRLDASELEQITFGHTWTGRDSRGNRFVQQFTADGETVFRGHASLMTGRFRLEDDDLLCIAFPTALLGRENCGHVYRNPEDSAEQQGEYVRVSAGDVYHFSVSPNY